MLLNYKIFKIHQALLLHHAVIVIHTTCTQHLLFHVFSFYSAQFRVLLMKEMVNLSGGSAHTLMQSHMQAAGLQSYLNMYQDNRKQHFYHWTRI